MTKIIEQKSLLDLQFLVAASCLLCMLCVLCMLSKVPQSCTYCIRRNFHHEKIFANFAHACSLRFFFPRNFCRVKSFSPGRVLTVTSCSFWRTLLARCHYYLIFKLHLGETYSQDPPSRRPTLLSIAPHSELRKARSDGLLSSWMRRLRSEQASTRAKMGSARQRGASLWS